METSLANAGGGVSRLRGAMGGARYTVEVARWLLVRHAPLSFRLQPDSRQWRWLAAFLRNCSSERFFGRNKARMQRIAHYSRPALASLREETGSPTTSNRRACSRFSAPMRNARWPRAHPACWNHSASAAQSLTRKLR